MPNSVEVPEESPLEPISNSACLLAGETAVAATCLENKELF
jgi:hypothetical protein